MTDPVAVEELLADLAPRGTGVAACRSEESLLAGLTAEEQVLVAPARPTRRAEFAAGRTCAHRALAAIDADEGPIGRTARREPVWPAGITGSISHAAGLAAAVVSPRTRSVTGLGLDLELVDALDEELWAQVMTSVERANCDAADDPAVAATALFSAKEAAFKAFYPLLGVEIDFLDAHAELEDGAGAVTVPSLGLSASMRCDQVGSVVVCLATVSTLS